MQPAVHFVGALYLGGIISEATVLARKALGRKFFLSSSHGLD